MTLAATVEAAEADDRPTGVFPQDGANLGTQTCAACHPGYVEQLSKRRHGQTADRQTPMALAGCEACHGPGQQHVQNITTGKTGGIVSFAQAKGESFEVENGICLQCHEGGTQFHWHASAHAAAGVACHSCHSAHKPSPVSDRATEAELCLGCHQFIRSEIYRASSHPIREGNLLCSDCHNSHGSAGPASLNQLSINENCYRCHAETRGPFLWEHYPVSEDCSLCHRVHGSNHYALLNKTPPFLCQQCHADVRFRGQQHVRRFFDFDFSDTRRRSRFVLGQSCMNCHSQVHGSNHPSGAALMR